MSVAGDIQGVITKGVGGVYSVCIDGGKEMTKPVMQHLCDLNDSEAIANEMPMPFRRLLIEGGKGEAAHEMENRLWKHLLAYCVKHFYDFSNPGGGILLYPYLLRFETTNLCRIYEGIRFGLPARVIRGLLIDDANERK